jgi:hypothetical protein
MGNNQRALLPSSAAGFGVLVAQEDMANIDAMKAPVVWKIIWLNAERATTLSCQAKRFEELVELPVRSS